MYDKSKWKTKVEKHGNIIAVYFTGGGECLWLNMYLDMEDWQMTCDSDIGAYAYRWGKPRNGSESFLSFCCRWLYDDEWLLRKCVGEKNRMEFCADHTAENLRDKVKEWYGDKEYDQDALEEILEEASGYLDNSTAWFAAVGRMAEEQDFELPEEWYCCGVYDYSVWQKRFAEICAESIVPELEAYAEKAEAEREAEIMCDDFKQEFPWEA